MKLDDLRNSLPEDPILFLDDGGVMSDNTLRAPEWLRLIGEFMPPRMGGSAEAWQEANRTVFRQIWADLIARISTFATYEEFWRTHAIEWVDAMCGAMNIERPDEEDGIALYRELSLHVAENANCAFDGAPEAIFALEQAGYTLYTASGTPSWELRGITGRMGVASAFSKLYGPDLIDHVKYGPAFYQRLFEDSGVSPEKAVVIESDSECCDWARQAGATAYWIEREGRGDATSFASLAQQLL